MQNKMNQFFLRGISVVLFCFTIFALPETVFSHSTFGSIEKVQGLLIVAEYDDGELMSYAAVEITCNGDAHPFQTGRTDRNGQFMFSPDKSGEWNIRIKDEMGHLLQLSATTTGDNSVLKKEKKRNDTTKSSKIVLGTGGIFWLSGFFFWLRIYRGNVKKQL